MLLPRPCCCSASSGRAQNYRYEAELGSYGGASFQNSTPGYSGTGYVTFNNNNTSSYVQVSAAVPQGLYELWFGYNSPFGFKGYDYQVNGPAAAADSMATAASSELTGPACST